jgi:hypothetical protein
VIRCGEQALHTTLPHFLVAWSAYSDEDQVITKCVKSVYFAYLQ